MTRKRKTKVICVLSPWGRCRLYDWLYAPKVDALKPNDVLRLKTAIAPSRLWFHRRAANNLMKVVVLRCEDETIVLRLK
jgi:hypothetical protein